MLFWQLLNFYVGLCPLASAEKNIRFPTGPASAIALMGVNVHAKRPVFHHAIWPPLASYGGEADCPLPAQEYSEEDIDCPQREL